MLRSLLLLASIVVLPMAPALAQEGCVEDGALHRPEVAPPQPEANGAVLVRAGGRLECLEIIVRGVAADLPLVVTLRGGDRVIAMGDVPVGEEVRRLVRCGGEGDTLPGDVEHVSQLFEYEIVVAQRDEAVVLIGRVPVVECRDEPGPDEPHEEALPETAVAFLTGPGGAPSAAGGKLTLTRDGDREVFRLDLAGLAGRATSRFLLADAAGTLTQLSAFLVPDRGTATFVYDTGEGGALPLDAASLDALIGRRLEIHDSAGAVVLAGVVPAFDAEPPVAPANASARNALVRPEAPLLPDAMGDVTVARADGEERFAISIDRVRPFHDLELLVERASAIVEEREDDGPNAGFLVAATLRADGAGSVSFELDTADGDVLPLNASLTALAGRLVRIVDPTAEAIVLHGRVPPLSAVTKPVKVSGKHVDEDTGAAVRIGGRTDPRTGRDRLIVDMRRLPRDEAPAAKTGAKKGRRSGDRVRLFFEDAAGQLVEVRDVPVRAGRRARMRFRTRRGDALPGGASSLRELSGRVFEIRVGNTPAVRGFVPFF